MADDGMTPESVSREAHERVTRERDTFKEQVGELTGNVKDLGIEVGLFKHFTGQGIENAEALAKRALPKFQETPLDDLAAQADKWYAEEKELFGGANTAAPAEEPETPVPPSPFQSAPPNPQSSGEGIQQTTLVAGTPEFEAWAKGRSLAEQAAAVERGDVVIPEAVKLAQL